MMPITKKSIAIDGRIFPDRRRELRHRVLKGAKLSFNNGYGASECVVRNLSEQGAKLAFGDTFGVPRRFRLHIAGERSTYEADVCWRGIGEIGVRFT
ncbi:PilZ domain-containing protein [Nitratireductor sp. CAU 1489]|uniref:PilZ domain-containing protein n=1 Tax=Nitratireductor arenosus TaxID=2682096 RepID=A0A844QD77_9HYPH|nr:PilZ domain-containing protein [Nitratireductor arenosus]MVA97212.1 PilZ domain-containing protein [Nitratireductor arenosus]